MQGEATDLKAVARALQPVPLRACGITRGVVIRFSTNGNVIVEVEVLEAGYSAMERYCLSRALFGRVVPADNGTFRIRFDPLPSQVEGE